jgi:hypothetical protein
VSVSQDKGEIPTHGEIRTLRPGDIGTRRVSCYCSPYAAAKRARVRALIGVLPRLARGEEPGAVICTVMETSKVGLREH